MIRGFKAVVKMGAALALIFSLSGCGMVDQILQTFKPAHDTANAGPTYRYRADLQITLGDRTYDGFAATKLDGPITFAIESKVRLDRLEINSCSRHVVWEKVDKNWFGGVGKKFTYTYTPNSIEAREPCPLYIMAFDRAGLATWGFIGFRTEETLPSKVSCNGTGWTFQGFTVCQTKAGYVQTIHFDSEIKKFRADENCNLERKSPGDFEISPDLGFCFATFHDGGSWHRAVFLGYETVLTRGE